MAAFSSLEFSRERTMRALVPCVLVVMLTAGCAQSSPEKAATNIPVHSAHLFSAETVLQDDWMHVSFRGKTDYRIAVHYGLPAIKATGRLSASALIRRVFFDPVKCPWIEWIWDVTTLQKNADLRIKDLEDVAASIFLLFGDPGSLFDPISVPALRYVWTNDRVPLETLVDNPYLPGIVRSIVVRNGIGHAKGWVTERRDIVADYRRAFGSAPTDSLQAIALFTDNDQTKQPVLAYYGQGRMICSGKG